MATERDKRRQERIFKLQGKLRHDWEELDALNAKDLEKKIVECQANLIEQIQEQKEDSDLTRAKERAAELAEPYKSARQRLMCIMEYATLRLEGLGKL